MHLYGDAQGAGDRAENPQLRKSGHFASPLTLPTAALFAAYFFGLGFDAAAVFAALGFLVRAGVRPVGLWGRWGVFSITLSVASRRRSVSSSE